MSLFYKNIYSEAGIYCACNSYKNYNINHNYVWKQNVYLITSIYKLDGSQW